MAITKNFEFTSGISSDTNSLLVYSKTITSGENDSPIRRVLTAPVVIDTSTYNTVKAIAIKAVYNETSAVPTPVTEGESAPVTYGDGVSTVPFMGCFSIVREGLAPINSITLTPDDTRQILVEVYILS